jgi:hypothetical protein
MRIPQLLQDLRDLVLLKISRISRVHPSDASIVIIAYISICTFKIITSS